jgi:hypothetical protein
VLDHLPGDPRHLRWLPSEDVSICLEEGNERKFLFFSQIPCDAGGLGGVRTDLDGIRGPTVCPSRLHFRCLGGRLGTGASSPSSGRAISVARVCSFSTATRAAVRSPCTVRIPVGDDILRTKFP